MGMLKDKTILVTGGTGSFGKKFTKIVLDEVQPAKLIIYSRDELKQYEMSQKFSKEMFGKRCPMRYLIGDVRDENRLLHAFKGVDIVVHAAALKQVPSCEYNPMEAVKTNVIGSMNVVTAAINAGVKRMIALSTDKAASPINLYGATKLCADKIITAAKAYAGGSDIKFSVVRYGNVFGSRGSVVPFFLQERSKGVLPITDERMTRFWITLQQGVDFVLACLDRMKGGEVFVPKIPSMKITDLAKALAPECKHNFMGIRDGEKIHEMMIGSDDARSTLEFDDYFIIGWNGSHNDSEGKPCSLNFRYGSDNNDQWLTVENLQEYVEEFLREHPEYAHSA